MIPSSFFGNFEADSNGSLLATRTAKSLSLFIDLPNLLVTARRTSHIPMKESVITIIKYFFTVRRLMVFLS